MAWKSLNTMSFITSATWPARPSRIEEIFRNDHASGCTEADQGKGSQVHRPSLHRYAGQGTARVGAVESLQQRQIRVRSCVRRLVYRRMERHPGLGHAADA